MSTLNALLKDVPVEWKKLWEVTIWDKRFNSVENYKQNKTIKYNYLLASEIKPLIIDNGDIKLLTTNESNLWTTENLLGHKYSEGEIIAIPWGGNPIVQYYKGKFLTGDNRIAVVNDDTYLSAKFLYYYLNNNLDLIASFYRGSGIKHPSMSKVLDLDIPIPPIAIQQEIVRVLDSLSEQNKALTTALAQELDQRKKQYAYYREELFRFEGKKVEWKTLGEVATIGTGSHDTKDAVEDGIYAFYARGIKPLKLNTYDFDETAIITAGDGVGVGKVFHWVEGKYALHQRAYKIVPLINVNPRYIYYYVLSNFLVYVEKQSVHSSVTSLRKPMFIKFPVAIPSYEEQERIVRLLDQFDEATKNIVAQLEKEIELRNKQYQYYRNLLLSFQKGNN